MSNLYTATQYSLNGIYVQCQIDELIQNTKSLFSILGEQIENKQSVLIINESFEITFLLTKIDNREGCNAHYYKLVKYKKLKKPEVGKKIILMANAPNNKIYKHGLVCTIIEKVDSKNFYILSDSNKAESKIMFNSFNFLVI